MINKYQYGSTDPILDRIYKRYPALRKLGKVSLKSDINFNKSVTGGGDIEYFSPTQDTVTYNNGFKYAHPAIGTHAIVYNPSVNDDETIGLDMLHGLSSVDPNYARLKSQLTNAFLNSKFKRDIDNEWKEKSKEPNDGYEQFQNN